MGTRAKGTTRTKTEGARGSQGKGATGAAETGERDGKNDLTPAPRSGFLNEISTDTIYISAFT